MFPRLACIIVYLTNKELHDPVVTTLCIINMYIVKKIYVVFLFFFLL